MTFAQRAYVSLLVAEGYEEQVPEHVAARWWHLLWLVLPVVGILMFIEHVRACYKP